MNQEAIGAMTSEFREALRRLSAGQRHCRTEEAAEALEALRRLDDGTYGSCADCGLVIAEMRLRARPHALRCLGCQSAREQPEDVCGEGVVSEPWICLI